MHHRPFWALCLLACALTSTWLASEVAAQPAASPPPAAAEPATPTPPPPGEPAAPPPAATPTPPAEPVPPIPPPPPASPPPPVDVPPDTQYGRLGGKAESEVIEGEWNPWDHPEASGGGQTHEGFFLRLQLGPGGSSVTREREDWSGMGLGMGLAIGGSPVENVALHLDLQISWMFTKEGEVNGIGLQLLGLGATWYIMPVDIFLSGNIGIGVLSFENDDGQSKDTSAGPAFDIVVGKEWWVGSDWGIGFAGQFMFMHVQDYTDDEGMDAFAINLLFTATYN